MSASFAGEGRTWVPTAVPDRVLAAPAGAAASTHLLDRLGPDGSRGLPARP
jgi:hypothetical protein